jgi:hypothetical protein
VHFLSFVGDDPSIFSVEMMHKGFFCGKGASFCYVSSSTAYVDYCNTETWSILWIDEMLKQLGYERDGMLHIYWSPPGMAICEGLVCIETDVDIVSMIRATKQDKTLFLFIDHSDFVKGLREEVIINRGPPVVSPKNSSVRDVATAKGTSGITTYFYLNIIISALHISTCFSEIFPSISGAKEGPSRRVADLEFDAANSEDDNDSDFVDSDYDAEDGDDDLFHDHVDKDVNDNNEKEHTADLEDDNAIDDDDLNLTKEEVEQLQYKFRAFNPEVDMDNPIFKVGMLFADVKECRNALASYSIRNRVKVNKIKNEPGRLEAVCSEGCPWWLKASSDSRSGGFIIRAYVGEHTCEAKWELKALSAPFLTKAFMEEFRDNNKMDLKTFAKKVQREYNMCPNRWKLSRARLEALRQIHGDEAGQFRQLWDYGQELRRSNPGSNFFLSTNQAKDNADDEAKEHLATLYWSYDACKRGFLTGCRPLICVDGCHIKTRYKGQLLTAVGIDPNDCIFPIAMGLVEVECTSSWEWFLTSLRDDLNITNTSPWTIMSDKQKVCFLKIFDVYYTYLLIFH